MRADEESNIIRFSLEVGKREEEQGLISLVMAFSAAGERERIRQSYCIFFARSHHSLIVGLGKSLLNIQDGVLLLT